MELIRQHRLLHAVPIVVTVLDVAAAMREGRLSTYRGVHAVELPCEVELLQGVIGRVQPCSGTTITPAAALRDIPTGRLPDLCPHGYAPTSLKSCRVCRAAGTEFAMASLGDSAPYADR